MRALHACLLPPIIALLPSCVAAKDSFDTRADFHDVTVSWHIKNLDDTTAPCPTGFTTLFIHLYNAGFVEPPDALLKLPCTSEGSVTTPVATSGYFVAEENRDQPEPGRYLYHPLKDIWIDLSEETFTAKAATSFLYYVAALDNDLTLNFDLYPAGGVGVVAWRLLSAASGAPLTSCKGAGVDTIEAAARPFGDDAAPLQVIGRWPCDQYDPYFHYDPVGNGALVQPDTYQLGSGHTRAVAAIDSGYFVELRALRGTQVVGKKATSFIAPSKNGAAPISDGEIPIDGL